MKLGYRLLPFLLVPLLLGFGPDVPPEHGEAAASTSSSALLAEGIYRLTARHSGLVLTVKDASSSAGADVVQSPWEAGEHQLWRLRYESDDSYTLIAQHSNLVLDTHGTRNGNNVKQAADGNGRDDQWRIRVVRNGQRTYYRLNNAYSGKSLNVRGGSTAPGATVDQERYREKTHQQWLVERAGRAGGGVSAPPAQEDPPSSDPSPEPIADGPVRLPLEVIGAKGYTVQAALPVADASGVSHLYLQVHRPDYRDVSKNRKRGAKASVRLNGGPWVDLTNQTVRCLPHEARAGCMIGAYHTLRFTMELGRLGRPGLRKGQNVLTFRFNGTDTITGGYRVLDLNLLRGGASGARVLPKSAFAYDNPASWKAPRPSQTDIAAGKKLWYEAKLVNHPGGPPIKATCSSCHAQDGRDLKYFNYSNRSIQERARFHNLSPKEAEQIASYIRSLKTPAPKQARPWNPPYQPGPGLDRKPVEEWAAGAGLEWVLEKDADMQRHLFAGSSAKKAVAPHATLNAREMPVALQLPDWNAWLPDVHPVDVWGDFFLKTTPISGSNRNKRGDVLGQYDQLKRDIERKGISKLIRLGYLDNRVEGFSAAGIKYFLDGRYGKGLQNRPKGMREEEATRSVRHWTAVKLWEVAQEYGLEDKAPDVYGKRGEPRSWLGFARQVFDLAPHLAADQKAGFAFHNSLAGSYFSSAWYHLQVVLNAGNRHGSTVSPVDWNYQSNFSTGIGEKNGGVAHPYRAAQTWAKLIQSFHNNAKFHEGAYVRQAHPGRWGGHGSFQSLSRRERAALFTPLLTAYMDAVESHDGEWTRSSKRRTWEPASYVPKKVDNMSWLQANQQGRYADLWYTMIPTFRQWGIDGAVLERLIDWGEEMWPKGKWDALRRGGSSKQAPDADLTATSIAQTAVPDTYALEGAYPTPFNPATTIRYALPEPADVRLEVFNALGRRVAVLVNERLAPGRHEAHFEASRLPSGMYLYRIEATGAREHFASTGKALLVK